MPVYSDMKPTLEITREGTISKVYDSEVVVQSIKTILATVSGERVRNPIGASVVRLLFQPMNQHLVKQLRTEIADTIVRYEPRVSIESFNITPYYDENYYDIAMLVRIKGIAQVQKVDFKLRSFAGNI